MTEKLHYPDLFTTIDIPKPERRLAIKAKNMLDIASGLQPFDPAVHEYLCKQPVMSKESHQAFWDFNDINASSSDRLALTVMHRRLTIALIHTSLDDIENNFRESLLIADGRSRVYMSDMLGRGGRNDGTSSELAIASFKVHFLDTTAHLGLYNRIKSLRTDQSESDAASFESAA